MRFIKNLLYKLVNRCITPPIKENIDINRTEQLRGKIFDITERDIKLRFCGEPSRFIKKYMKISYREFLLL